MARFRGSVQGSRGAATRLGHRRLLAFAEGWNGRVTVYVWRDDDDRDCYRVTLDAHGGASHEIVLAEGLLEYHDKQGVTA